MLDSFPQQDSINVGGHVESGSPVFPRDESVDGPSEGKVLDSPSGQGRMDLRISLASLTGRTVHATALGLRQVRELLQKEQGPKEPSSFKTPYCEVTFTEAKKAIEGGEVTIKTKDQKKPHVTTADENPAIVSGLRAALSEIDNQVIDNFGVFESTVHPGVKFSYSKLSITPDVVKRIVGTVVSQEEIDSRIPQTIGDVGEKPLIKNQAYFEFTAFDFPPGASPFTVQDVGIDRFMRELPHVAAALREGRPAPQIEIYLVGYPTGIGGQVTKEYVETLKKNGLLANGPMYAEFVQKMLPDDLSTNTKLQEETHVVLQGVSMGAVHADQTLKNLPEGIQKVTHGLLDNPAGTHAIPLQGVQVAAGLVGETVGRILFDPTMKGLRRLGGSFINYIYETKHIPADDNAQKSLKNDAIFSATGLRLLQGTPLETELTYEQTGEATHTRHFIRSGTKDPLTTGPVRFIRGLFGKGIVANEKGDSTEFLIDRTHFFMNKSYNKYAQVIAYCQSVI